MGPDLFDHAADAGHDVGHTVLVQTDLAQQRDLNVQRTRTGNGGGHFHLAQLGLRQFDGLAVRAVIVPGMVVLFCVGAGILSCVSVLFCLGAVIVPRMVIGF